MLRFPTALLLLVVISIYSIQLSAQSSGVSLQKGYYVVVAAYLDNQENFAKKYADQLNAQGKHASYGLDAARKFYYVYLDYYAGFDESIAQMVQVRKEAGFSEAWVRIIKDETAASEPVAAIQPEPKKVSATQQTAPAATPAPVATPTPAAPASAETKTVSAVEVAKAQTTAPITAPAELTAVMDTSKAVIPNPPAATVYVPQTLKNTQAFFSMYNATNGAILDGEVEVIDTDRSRLLSKMKANSYISLPDPNSKSGKITLIGSAFGYRKVQHEMNYKNTESDTTKDEIDLIGNYYMVKFDLTRMTRGDIATLYNVYFYNDAAVMLPESKYELNKLLLMMQENPKYRIMLHGHTNGNGRGKIIYVGPAKDFFNITKDDVVNESGSAKELSGARAAVIKEWLISQGIDASRIEVKAWGGGRMLHDKNSQHARRNVRVEVEVLQD
ncbi:MAG: OmpA family protein [Cyclobacteriaceae bacterium]|nr:OmpA family protein [Cyclobacteriaceae bacterium]